MKPLAWMYEFNNGNYQVCKELLPDETYDETKLKPLFTQKELTDDEILSIWEITKTNKNLYYDLLVFARFLLKKVAE